MIEAGAFSCAFFEGAGPRRAATAGPSAAGS